MPEADADVLVVGAGAAGILASWRAATLGAKVLLLEKTERIGTKILISGGGKCNITHAGPPEHVLSAFRKNEAAFLRPSLYRFPSQNILDLLEAKGLKVMTRPNGRVFPEEGSAKTVVAILRRYLEEVGVSLRYETPVREILFDGDSAIGVQTDGGPLYAPRIVVCSGGSSYPGTGTTGDGWEWMRAAGHTIVKVRAALAPIHMMDVTDWAGVSLRDCILRARQGGKTLAKWREDLLFTHHGVSGPCALGISREVAEAAGNGPITLEVDLTPDQSFEELSAALRDWLAANPKRVVRPFLEPFAPSRLVDSILSATAIQPETLCAHLDRKSRNRIVEVLKGWSLGVVRDVPIEKGEVVAGGVHLDEVDPKTMESRKKKGLYLCGEILDLAGPVGGYNLQAAWSTGFVAGSL